MEPALVYLGGVRTGVVVTTLIAVLLVSLPVAAEDTATDLPPMTELQAVVDRLGEEAVDFERGALIGITVLRFDTAERASYQGDQWLKSASSLKPTWVVAAIRESGIDALQPFAVPIWVQSSNKAGGQVIGLAGGLDPINDFTASIGMEQTLVVEWTPGGEWIAADYPGPHPALNFTSTDDLVTFWTLLHDGQLLSDADTAAVLAWSRLPRQANYPSGLLTRLPEAVEPYAAYKMGWLPPGRTAVDEETGETVPVVDRDTLVGSGIVAIPGGPAYAVAIGSFGGSDWPGKVAWVAYASCRIHETITDTDLECDRPGDPRRVRLDGDPPVGRLVSADSRAGSALVRGWALDPDDPAATTWVRITVDGRVAGAVRAWHPPSWGASPAHVAPGHGFTGIVSIPAGRGAHPVCAEALNDGDGPDSPLGCIPVWTEPGPR